ncbi:HAD family hydrolase [Acanthopleuribacter pedis]|uniref:phosphoglycolate phosphatase n=1 Tax=Acanthopleuribacter pedis TaxID=442870 RepID=A0A8J7QKE6_9BACT|nr:HAD family hydrolase [Acanthopleuribacter pedis]MBO1321575.1 HAD family hydrolase [Acanthopleuribacter pedis]
MRSIDLVITDLDNTLYDWVHFFTASLYAMTQKAALILSVSEEQLLKELQKVHQRYHNTEHPFALLETETVKHYTKGLSRKKQMNALDEAFHAFNAVRNRELTLYQGVRQGLQRLVNSGVTVVGHTEATLPNAVFRLKKLGLTPFFHGLHAPAHGGLPHPKGPSPTTANQGIKIVTLPPKQRKPDVAVLKGILDEWDAKPETSLYIGDSLIKDMSMAVEAGLASAWAKYGTHHPDEAWKKLVRISHWTEEDVAQAETLRMRYPNLEPDAVLDQSFEQIFSHFHFEPANKGTCSYA